jgi:hypothetical protein
MNTIPPITDPMGKYWDQPNPANFLLDDKHVLMSGEDFKKLSEYSCSMPSGVYPGKMWKHNNYAYRRGPNGETQQWFLRWFGLCNDPKFCSNHAREILIA